MNHPNIDPEKASQPFLNDIQRTIANSDPGAVPILRVLE